MRNTDFFCAETVPAVRIVHARNLEGTLLVTKYTNAHTCGEDSQTASPTSAIKVQTFLFNVCHPLTRVSVHRHLAHAPTVFWQQMQLLSTSHPATRFLLKQLLHSTATTPSQRHARRLRPKNKLRLFRLPFQDHCHLLN